MSHLTPPPTPAGSDSAEQLADHWRQAKRVVVLTGAGVSTASGIPDFRSKGGRWSNYQPVTIQEFRAGHDSRVEYWRYKGETWQVIRQAPANPAHLALTELAKADHIELLVTQNVDGLHERSGFPQDRLIHIHGTDSQVVCLDCGRREDRQGPQEAWEAGEAVPCCPCGGWWKPATISFGQQLVMEDLQKAFQEAAACDLFLAVGTSLAVSPINQMFSTALEAGSATAILTAGETPFDHLTTWRIDQSLETVLPKIRDLLLPS